MACAKSGSRLDGSWELERSVELSILPDRRRGLVADACRERSRNGGRVVSSGLSMERLLQEIDSGIISGIIGGSWLLELLLE